MIYFSKQQHVDHVHLTDTRL